MFDEYIILSSLQVCVLSFFKQTTDIKVVKMSDIDDDSEIFFSVKVSITFP